MKSERASFGKSIAFKRPAEWRGMAYIFAASRAVCAKSCAYSPVLYILWLALPFFICSHNSKYATAGVSATRKGLTFSYMP